MVKDGSLRRGEIGVLPQFAALDALAPDALVFRHRPLLIQPEQRQRLGENLWTNNK